MISSIELERFSRRVSEHLFGHVLHFWCGPALDEKNGGWMGWLTNDLRPDRSKPKGLILHARMLWTFSAAHRVRPQPVFLAMAQRAFDFLMNRFWDPKFGGTFWQLNDEGRVIDDSKKIYGQAFCIYALTEFHRTFGSEAALARATELFWLLDRHAHDNDFSGYIEVCNRDWSEAGPGARLSEKDLAEKKSMNNHLHLLEAFTNLSRVSTESFVRSRVAELIRVFDEHILNPFTHHLNHFFDEEWRLRSDTCTYGHDIEASWLLCEAAEVMGDKGLTERIRHLAVQMAAAALDEGMCADGGLYYEGRRGDIIDRGREWWPQAEALVGFINAFEISGDEKFFAAALKVWDFIEQKIVDRVHGEWFWRIHPNGQPDTRFPKVSEWKDPYHGVRACLEAIRRVHEIVTHPPRINPSHENESTPV